MLTAIRNWVLRTMMKDQTGVMRTLPRKDIFDFNVAMTAERLMRNGIDPRSLKNANQVDNALRMIDDRPAVQEGITSTESAKVFNIKGDELDPNKPIIGGTQPGKKIDTDTFIRLAERNPQLIKQKIADKKVETDAEIKARLDKDNKEGIAKIRARQKMLDDAIDNQSPSLSGDTRTDAVLVAEDLAERMGLAYDDLPIREQTKLYDQAYQGLSKMRFEARQTPKGAPPKITSKKDADSQESSYDDGPADFDPDADNETFAQGGRAGFKDGMTRRTFLKLLGGMAAVPIVGKFFKLAKVGKTVTKVPMIKTDDVAGKPEWFDALVNKVIMEGDDVTKKFATGERQSIHQKTLDDGSVVRVTEDVDDGAVRVEYESEQNVFGDDVMLQYKKPLPDEGDPRPSARFDVAESGPVGRSVGPDDFEIDVDEVGGQSIRDLDSDVSKLKEYATGKKPTMKEIVEIKKRKDRAAAITDDIDGAASDAVVRRQGDYDPSDYDDGMASGGIAGLLGE